MAVQKGWKVNVNRCFSCRACEVACKAEYSLAAGEGRRRRVVEKTVVLATGTTTGVEMPVATFFIPCACNHCEDPSCVKACPRGALTKTSSYTQFNSATHAGITSAQYSKINGIVLHDPTRCIGCRRCEAACPYGAPQYNPTTHKVHKCEWCWQRVTDYNSIGYGNEYAIPACVRQCGGSLAQRADSSLPAAGPVTLKHGPALELVDVDTSTASGVTYSGESQVISGTEYAKYYRAGAGGGLMGMESTGADSSRALGSRFLAPATLTKPALRIRNRMYVKRDGTVTS